MDLQRLKAFKALGEGNISTDVLRSLSNTAVEIISTYAKRCDTQVYSQQIGQSLSIPPYIMNDPRYIYQYYGTLILIYHSSELTLYIIEERNKSFLSPQI